jgi:hypothetical protein
MLSLRLLAAWSAERAASLRLSYLLTLVDKARTEFFAEVDRLTLPCRFKSSRQSDIKWCQPKLTVRVKHLAGTKTPRHATVRALER